MEFSREYLDNIGIRYAKLESDEALIINVLLETIRELKEWERIGRAACEALQLLGDGVLEPGADIIDNAPTIRKLMLTQKALLEQVILENPQLKAFPAIMSHLNEVKYLK
jgi:hypothetical protein